MRLRKNDGCCVSITSFPDRDGPDVGAVMGRILERRVGWRVPGPDPFHHGLQNVLAVYANRFVIELLMCFQALTKPVKACPLPTGPPIRPATRFGVTALAGAYVHVPVIHSEIPIDIRPGMLNHITCLVLRCSRPLGRGVS